MTLLRETALALPLFMGAPDEAVPPLCGAIPAEATYVIPAGHYVAAKVKVRQKCNLKFSSVCLKVLCQLPLSLKIAWG